ncbi:zinc finger protein CONSTANS-LIKE 1 [Amborella trichopoda]|uniref:CCT domain-containing protein n=1 Tax=Amborella trichopoda TaxID=13333 RepID=W1Q0M7_AMBTC|nr:zinc finger protein CONSTANS-LIKE 1 [Amborella trichopoda]ERN14124.1 hypothetical protein AMTR_s00021p00245010 [Amborella trichopoda]|eukprot:XP_006852657.1 zinc finger protein CONSTANS-LIKE 1 [Amborella trichopoda]
MYAEAGLLFPYCHGFSNEVQHFEEFCRFRKQNAWNNLVQTPSILEYDLGEGDLFKAPETIPEEPPILIDPLSAMSIMSDKALELDTTHLLNEVFHGYEKELGSIGVEIEGGVEMEEKKKSDGDDGVDSDIKREVESEAIQRSASLGCLRLMDTGGSRSTMPTFLDFEGVDLGAAFGMRRAYSAGDIQTLGNNGNPANIISRPLERQLTVGNYTHEERKERLNRYWKKKTKRNFDRKIKYACRKALADCQPRVRGRFAKMD